MVYDDFDGEQRLLGGFADGLFQQFEGPPMPLVRLAEEDELREAAQASPLLGRFRCLLDWLGTAGKPTDRSGWPGTKGAAELADLLNRHQPDARSARGIAEIPEVVEPPEIWTLLEWALAAGLVGVRHAPAPPYDTLLPREPDLLEQPARLWDRSFHAFNDLVTDLVNSTPPDGVPAPFSRFFPTLLPTLWMTLYSSGSDGIPLEVLHGVMIEARIEQYQTDTNVAWQEAESHRADLRALLELLALLGAVRLDELTDPEDLPRLREVAGRDEPDLALVTLTPSGIRLLHSELDREGIDVPVVGDAAEESLAVVCDRIARRVPGTTDPDLIEEELQSWIDVRHPGVVLYELASFVRTTDSAVLRYLTLTALVDLGDEAVAEMHAIRSEGGIAGAMSAAMLATQELIDAEDLTEQETLLTLVDQLTGLLAEDVEVLIDNMQDSSPEELIALLDGFAEVDHPGILELLTAIAQHHPDDSVRAAADRAAAMVRLRRE